MLSLCTILPNTLELLRQLSVQPEIASMRLVGGTALALQFGHRQSVDLDFFSTQSFHQDDIIAMFSRLGEYTVINRTKNILQVNIQGIKVDIVNYSCYGWIDEPVISDGITMASAKDIAAMKVNAIMGRGSRKDFIDVFMLLKHFSMEQIMDFYHQKYPEYSEYRAIMSLTYFDDAEIQDMPLMFIHDTWEDMKTAIIAAVKAYQK